MALLGIEVRVNSSRQVAAASKRWRIDEARLARWVSLAVVGVILDRTTRKTENPRIS